MSGNAESSGQRRSDQPPSLTPSPLHVQGQLAYERQWLKVSLLADGVLKAFPALASVWYDLAKAKTQLGDLEAASMALKRACELDAGLNFWLCMIPRWRHCGSA